MKQAQLVKVLVAFGRANRKPQHGRTKGQATFALFLAHYIEKLEIPADQEYDFWEIDNHIPRIIVGAIRTFEKSVEPWVVGFRKTYEEETEHLFYDPTRVHAGNNVYGALEVEMIKNLVHGIMGPRADYLQHEIDVLLNAERSVVGLRFNQFLDQVYHVGGLSKIIAECRKRGMSGKFGETTLRSFVTAGRLMFTFARGSEENEDSVSFVCEEDDLIGLGSWRRIAVLLCRTAHRTRYDRGRHRQLVGEQVGFQGRQGCCCLLSDQPPPIWRQHTVQPR